jgi:hypothetical protein
MTHPVKGRELRFLGSNSNCRKGKIMKNILPTNNLRKRFAWMHVAVLSLAVVCFSCSFIYAGDIAKESPSSQKGIHLLSTFEGGKLYSAGKFRVLELSGTYRQMGRQYGRLMSGPMTEPC